MLQVATVPASACSRQLANDRQHYPTSEDSSCLRVVQAMWCCRLAMKDCQGSMYLTLLCAVHCLAITPMSWTSADAHTHTCSDMLLVKNSFNFTKSKDARVHHQLYHQRMPGATWSNQEQHTSPLSFTHWCSPLKISGHKSCCCLQLWTVYSLSQRIPRDSCSYYLQLFSLTREPAAYLRSITPSESLEKVHSGIQVEQALTKQVTWPHFTTTTLGKPFMPSCHC